MANFKGIQDACPCRHCDERTPSCHGKCKAYIDWKAEISNVSKIIKENKSERMRTFPNSIINNIKRKNN